VSLSSCVVASNAAADGGGAFVVSDGTYLVCIDCRIESNTSTYTGGGLRWELSAEGGVLGGLVSYNKAGEQGGGVSVAPYSTATIEQSTFSSNEVLDAYEPYYMGGGGIQVAGVLSKATLTLLGSCIHGNTSLHGQDLRCDPQSEVRAVDCNIGDIYGTLSISNNVISTDPIFADAANGDFHLLYGSPCIDAGSTNAGASVDMDGEARPFGVAMDMGADEFVDADGDNMADYWEVREFGDTGTTEGTEDTDGDLLDTFGEYMNQTDPHSGDTDGDVMPDGWEVTNSLNAKVDDGSLDADGDFFSNLDEYSADTDPQDAGSLLRVTFIGEERGGRRVEWQGGVNAWQTIERSAGLGVEADWKLLWYTEPPTPVSNAVIVFQSAERQFYRVRAGR